MGHKDIEQLARAYDFGVLPKFREVSLVPSHEIVRMTGISTRNEDIIIEVRSDFRNAGRCDDVSLVPDQLQGSLVTLCSLRAVRWQRQKIPVRGECGLWC